MCDDLKLIQICKAEADDGLIIMSPACLELLHGLIFIHITSLQAGGLLHTLHRDCCQEKITKCSNELQISPRVLADFSTTPVILHNKQYKIHHNMLYKTFVKMRGVSCVCMICVCVTVYLVRSV